VRTVRDAIEDLEGLNNTWDLQPPPSGRYPATFSDYYGGDDGGEFFVDSHVWRTEGVVNRTLFMAEQGDWAEGEPLPRVVKRYGERFGRPDAWDERAWDSLHDPKRMHINAVTRAYYDRPGYVITGAGGGAQVHPVEPRFISVREAYRLMGFPDDWTITWAKNVGHANTVSGKQIPVESTRWLCKHIKNALEGRPGAWHGEDIGGDGEFVVNCTSDYLRVFHGRTFEHGVDGRSKALREEMERRPA